MFHPFVGQLWNSIVYILNNILTVHLYQVSKDDSWRMKKPKQKKSNVISRIFIQLIYHIIDFLYILNCFTNLLLCVLHIFVLFFEKLRVLYFLLLDFKKLYLSLNKNHKSIDMLNIIIRIRKLQCILMLHYETKLCSNKYLTQWNTV